MKVSLECTYCGEKWIEDVYNTSYLQGKECKKPGCKDTNLIVKDLSNKIDYYQGAPSFPKKDSWNGVF